MSGSKPLAKFGANIRLTAWRTRNGSVSFSVEKQYKDKTTNKWVSTSVWYEEDLKKLNELIPEARKFALEDKEQRKEWSKPQDDLPY